MTKIRHRTKEDRQDSLALTAEDASDLLGISVYLVRRMIKEGKLPAIKLGKLTRIPKVRLLAMMAGDENTKQG